MPDGINLWHQHQSNESSSVVSMAGVSGFFFVSLITTVSPHAECSIVFLRASHLGAYQMIGGWPPSFRFPTGCEAARND